LGYDSLSLSTTPGPTYPIFPKMIIFIVIL
jgi:hypothetical protein